MTIDPNMRRVSARSRAAIVAIAVALGCLPSVANAIFIVNQPWLLPAGKAQATRAFMNLTSTDGATLVSVRSQDARKVSVHSARSRVGAPLPLPAKREVVLAPGRDHLTLTGLTRNLRLGDRVVLVLTVRDVDGATLDIPVSAEVRRRSPVDDERRARHHH